MFNMVGYHLIEVEFSPLNYFKKKKEVLTSIIKENITTGVLPRS